MLDDEPPGDHRADIVQESGENHFEDVNQNESDERETGDEVNRPRRLASAQDGQDPRKRGIDRRRHREAGQHNQRRHDEQDAGIGQFLKHVVPLSFGAGGMSKDQMIFD
jgi:hypothetical protein